MANPFDQFDTPTIAAPAAEENPFDQFDRGIAATLAGHFAQGIAEMATSPFRALHAGAEHARDVREKGLKDVGPVLGAMELADKYMPRGLYSGGWLDQPEPRTTGEKYAAAVGGGLAAAAIPELALVGKAPALARVATPAAGALRRTVGDIGKFYSEKPGVALTTGGAAAATSAAGSEAAKEAGLGPGYQVAAGMAAPIATVAPLAAAGKLAQATEFVTSRMGIPTITPSATLAGWEARGGPWRAIISPFSTAKAGGRWLNDLILSPRQTIDETLNATSAQRILRRIGFPLSADAPPTATLPVGDEEAVARAYQVLANYLQRSGRHPDDLLTVLNNFSQYRRLHSSGLAPNTLFLADLDESLRTLAGALARTGSARPLEAVVARQTGITPETANAEQIASDIGLPTRQRYEQPLTGAEALKRLGSRFSTPRRSNVPMGQQEVMEDGLRRALLVESQPHHGHQITGLRTIERIAADRELESGPAYDKAYAAGWRTDGSEVDFRPVLGPLLDAYEAALAQEPAPVANAIRKGIGYFRQALDATPYEPSSIARTHAPGTSGPRISLPRRNMVERLDRAKRVFDEEVIGPMFKKPGEQSPWTAGVVNKFKSDVLEAIDGLDENNVGPLYQEARDIWGSRAETIDDIRLGMEASEPNSKTGADVFVGANANVRLGLYEGLRLQMLRMGGSGTDVAKLFDNKRIMQILATAIPKTEKSGRVFSNRPMRFGGYVNMQQAQVRTLNEIARGSPTAARTQALQDLQDMHVIAEAAAKKGVRGIATEIAYTALNKFFGYRRNTADALARMLFTTDLATNRATIEGIRQHMGPERFTMFTRLMAQLMEEGTAARGAIPGAAVATQPQPPAESP